MKKIAKNLLFLLMFSFGSSLLAQVAEDPLWGFSANSSNCEPNATTWYLGGNNIQPPPVGTGTPPLGYFSDIGTCDNSPFILKANNFRSVFIQPSGFMGINTNMPGAALTIKHPTLSLSSTFKIYGDLDGNVESSTSMKLHYGSDGQSAEFELKQGVPGTTAITRMAVDATGNAHFFKSAKVYDKFVVGPSTFTFAGTPRLAIDAKSTQGLLIVADASNDAIYVANSAGAGRLRMWTNSGGGDDSQVHIAATTQIGFYQSTGIIDANVRLNVDAYGSTKGIKVSTTNLTNTMLFAEYYDNTNNSYTTNFEVKGNGATYIGSARPSLTSTVCANAMLTVDGQILARDIRVSNSTGTHWADYVFDKNYKPMPLAEVEKYFQKNKHLPEIPSEADVKKDGVDLLDMNVALLKKVEELYLYTIELKKESEKQQNKIEQLSKEINSISK